MSVCWKYIKESLVYLVSVTENWCKKCVTGKKKKTAKAIWTIYQPGFILVMAKKDFAKEDGDFRLAGNSPMSFYTPTPLFLPFFCLVFIALSFPPSTSQTACLFGLAAAPKFNLSLTEVLVMFNPFRALRWENQSQAGREEKKKRRKRKQACPASCHLTACSRGFPQHGTETHGSEEEVKPI